jgi:phage gp36-like protein
MPYLDEAGYVARFGADELAQVQATDATIEFDVALADAEAIVDSYLAAVPSRSWAVPLVVDPIPRRIVEITADLVRYELHAKAPTEEIKRRRRQGLAFLEQLVAGKVAIVELVTIPTEAPAGSGILVESEPRVFDSTTLAGYLG